MRQRRRPQIGPLGGREATVGQGNGIGQIARPSDLRGSGDDPLTQSFRDARQTVALVNAIQHYAVKETRLGIPVLFHEEGLHGYAARDATSFPQSIALASSWDPEPDGFVWAMAFASGIVYVGGDFTAVGTSFTARNGVAAYSTLNGTLSSWNPGVQGSVRALAVSGTTIYVGGDLTMVGASPRTGVAAVSNSGSIRPSPSVIGVSISTGSAAR